MDEIPGPTADLSEVQRLVAKRRTQFAQTSARFPLRDKYGDERTGQARAAAIFAALTAKDYESSRHLPNPPADADVYGVECDGEQWYIKFYVDVDLRPPHDDVVQIVSFHPERFTRSPMTKRRKVVIP